MGALRMVFRATLRRGWTGLVVIALLIGVAGGVVLTGAEAYRRTTTAFDRMQEATESWDVLVNPDSGNESRVDEQVLAELPQVERVGRLDGVLLGSAHIEDLDALNEQPLTLTTDGVAGYDFARSQIVDGRMPAPDAADELLLDPTAADVLGLDVGDTYEGKLLSYDDFGEVAEATSADALARYNEDDFGTTVELEVVGIGVSISQLVVDEAFVEGEMFVTPAFWEAYEQPSAGFFGLVVDLAPGATVDELRAAVEASDPEESFAFQTADKLEEQVDRAVAPEANAVRVFTVIAALVGAVIVGQAISRRLQVDAVDDPSLRALGLVRGQRIAVAVGRMALAGVVGAGLAAVLAVLASPIGPVGVVRPAEPDPGVRVDVPVLVVGGLAVVVATVLVSIWPAVRATRAIVRSHRTSTALSSALVGWGVRPAAMMGARFALEPGRGRVPARSAMVGAATGVALVAATVTFAASLDHFVDSPDLYGTSWSTIVTVDTTQDIEQDDYTAVEEQLDDDDRVEAYSLVVPGQLTLDGHGIPAFALGDSARPLQPTVIDGRAPADADEVVLGTSTLDDLGLEVGDEVDVTSTEGEPGTLDVVGRAVLPVIASYPGADKTTLGEGAVMTTDGLSQWSPEFSPEGFATRFAPGVDAQDVVDDLEVTPFQFLDVDEVGRPSDVTSLDRVRSTPFVLTGLLVALIALTVGHVLGTAVRARRQELAVLRTFGFSRGQVLASVATQATLIAVVGLLVGIPVGIASGRVFWAFVAESRDAVVELITPALGITVLALAVLAVANLVGLVPGLRAARAHPATILRTE